MTRPASCCGANIDGGVHIPGCPGPRSTERVRPFAELGDSGLLWLINRVVFHPRGFALSLVTKDGEPVGWRLLGDGREVWRFSDDEGDLFARAERTLRGEQP